MLFPIPSVYAHPGNTASDGCHYCRTNCAKWGEVEDARHCHGGTTTTTTTNTYVAPLPSPSPQVVRYSPSPTPTKKPSPSPILPPSPVASVEPVVNFVPQVESASETKVNVKESEEVEPLTGGETAMVLGVLGGISFGAYKVVHFVLSKIKRLLKKPEEL